MSESASQFPNLGPFILLQAAVGIVIVGGAIIAWMRGERRTTDAPAASGGITMFFDGPIKVILETLAGIYRRLGEIKDEAADAHKELQHRDERRAELLR